MSLSQILIHSEDLNDEAKAKVLAVCFGDAPDSTRTPPRRTFRKFMDHYILEPKYLTFACRPGSYPISSLSGITHEDLCEVITILSQSKSQTRLQILQDGTYGGFWRSQSVGDKDRILDLAVRMWLMLNVQDIGLNTIIHPLWGPDNLAWDDPESLIDLITSAFPRSEIELNFRESRLDPGFTAQYLVDICGLDIRWTKSLHNHLRLDRRSKVLLIFPYTDFLLGHLAAGGRKVSL